MSIVRAVTTPLTSPRAFIHLSLNQHGTARYGTVRFGQMERNVRSATAQLSERHDATILEQGDPFVKRTSRPGARETLAPSPSLPPPGPLAEIDSHAAAAMLTNDPDSRL